MFIKPPYIGGSGKWFDLSLGDRGVDETAGLMAKMVRQSMADPVVKAVAVKAVEAVPKSDPRAYAESVFHFTRSHIKFVPDVHNIEELTSPAVHSRRILEGGMSWGDCDDFTMVQAAWLKSLGVPVRFAVVASRKNGGAFDHVRVEANAGGEWLPLESTIKRAKFGHTFPVLRQKLYGV